MAPAARSSELFPLPMTSRILIIDDHAVVRKMLKLLIETHAGWEVCGEAGNGLEALAKVTELKPDLVIMDLAMPVMDGIRASREISAEMPTVPILMHTLHYSPELELAAKKVGVRRVVAKAQAGEELLNAIEALLDEAGKTAGDTVSAPQVAAPTVDLANSTVPIDGVDLTASVGEEDLPKPD
jgi:DNA-binding NarL/FixJ family response regulator